MAELFLGFVDLGTPKPSLYWESRPLKSSGTFQGKDKGRSSFGIRDYVVVKKDGIFGL